MQRTHICRGRLLLLLFQLLLPLLLLQRRRRRQEPGTLCTIVATLCFLPQLPTHSNA